MHVPICCEEHLQNLSDVKKISHRLPFYGLPLPCGAPQHRSVRDSFLCFIDHKSFLIFPLRFQGKFHAAVNISYIIPPA